MDYYDIEQWLRLSINTHRSSISIIYFVWLFKNRDRLNYVPKGHLLTLRCCHLHCVSFFLPIVHTTHQKGLSKISTREHEFIVLLYNKILQYFMRFNKKTNTEFYAETDTYTKREIGIKEKTFIIFLQNALRTT